MATPAATRPPSSTTRPAPAPASSSSTAAWSTSPAPTPPLKTEAVDGVVEADKAKARCGGNPAWNIPMVVGPIAFAYNLDGVDKLVLTPEVLAQIFTGKITTWNDQAIAKLNSGATLPSSKISVFFRSDESGTTENVEQVPQGRQQRRLDRRAQQVLGGHRRGQEQVLRRRRGREEHPRLHLLHGVELREGQQPSDRPDRQRRGRDRADRRRRSARRCPRPRSRAPATTSR